MAFKWIFPYNSTWEEAFLYGAIISVTDPVAVVRPLDFLDLCYRCTAWVTSCFQPYLATHHSKKVGPWDTSEEFKLQVAIFKEVGASKRLGHLIDGESLLNDGSAYIFFLIAFDMVKGVERSNAATVGYFFRLCFGATGVGLAFGVALAVILLFIYRCASAQPTVDDSFHLLSGRIAVPVHASNTRLLTRCSRHNHTACAR